MRQNINFIEHQRAIYFKMSEDDRLSPFHVSMYHALFIIWNECGFDTELSINRNDVMKLSKIGNANTYTKVLKELTEFGYIVYKPSYNPLIGSKVTITTFGKGGGKGTDKGSVKGSSKGSGKGGDTLYKQVNNETSKQLNNINIPSISEFLEYVKTIEEFSQKFESLKFAIQSKYETWVSDGWKDGNGKKIINWKTKIKNTLPFLKPIFNTQQNGTERPKSKAEQLNDDYERVARECGIIPTNPPTHGGVDTGEFTDHTEL